jgi:phage terminase large subunit GpA-like protein
VYQVLAWRNLVWEKDRPQSARYRCEACEVPIENWQKTGMLASGEWRATAAGDGKTRGYHINALYAPVGWPSWGDLAAEFLEANKTRETLQVFCNTVWGEVWKDETALPLDADALYSRREPFGAEVPMGACLLTAGADVQADRIELEIVGWGDGEESWSVGYHVLYGDTGADAVWSELDRLLLRQWRHESGLELPITAACVDAGFEMAQVLEFCRPRLNRKVYATKGASGFGKPIWPRRASKGVHKGEFFMIGSDTAKERVYGKLRVNLAGPGYCHFPLNRERDWFDMLTAERIKARTVHGRAERYFYKPDGVRNEALDCRAYATAALHALYMSGFKLADQAARMKSMVAGKPDLAPAYQVYRSRFLNGSL